MEQKNIILQLVAIFSAVWAFKHIEYYREMAHEQPEIRKTYLLKLHAGQLIAIFRLLGIGYTTPWYSSFFSASVLESNLIEIGTGTIILSLFGFDVSCACYSKYLSERDGF